jgi:hypothetical protein
LPFAVGSSFLNTVKLDTSQVTIGDLQLLAGRGELDSITHQESFLLLSVDRNSNLAKKVTGGLLPISPVRVFGS